MKTNEDLTVVNEEVVVVNVPVTMTWDQVNEELRIKKEELKALGLLKKGLSSGSLVNQEEKEALKLKLLKEKWSESCPLGSKLLGCEVTFKSFGSEEIMYGKCFSIVLDKRVGMYLMKILSNGKIYHKDSKCINSSLFKYENEKLVKI